MDDPRLLLSAYGLGMAVWAEWSTEQAAAAAEGSAPEISLPLLHTPVTLALLAAAAGRFSQPVTLRMVCLSPFCVVERHEWWRLWACALVRMARI
jgi:hypothetical protein